MAAVTRTSHWLGVRRGRGGRGKEGGRKGEGAKKGYGVGWMAQALKQQAVQLESMER